MPDDDKCVPDGQVCDRCQGTHNPRPGVAFVTSRNWWSTPGWDDEPDGEE